MRAASPLSKKQARTIEYALTQLAGAKSLLPIRSIEDIGNVPFGHELQLTGQRMVRLSEHGMEQVRLIVRTLEQADPFDGMADYSDVWSACWKTLEELLSQNQMADSAEEWLDLISARITPHVRVRCFAAPFVGVELKDIDELALGPMKLVRPSVNHPDMLDEAIFRRFDDVVQYQMPSGEEVKALLRMRLANYLKSSKALTELSDVAIGLSPAEIARAVSDAIKEAVMHDQDTVTAEAVRSLLLQRLAVRLRADR